MTDQLAKVNNYKKKIASSQRKGIKGQRVEYFIVPADEGDNEKYKMPPHNLNLKLADTVRDEIDGGVQMMHLSLVADALFDLNHDKESQWVRDVVNRYRDLLGSDKDALDQ